MNREFIEALEKEFDIYISKDLANSFDKLEQFARYINSKYRQKRACLECSNEVGFFRLRKILENELNIPKEKLKPNSITSEVLKGNIRKKWSKLNKALDNKLHYYPLETHPVADNILLFLGFIAIVFGIYNVVTSSNKNFFGEILGVFGIVFLLYVFLNIILRPFIGLKVPDEFEVLKNLTYFLPEAPQIYKYSTYDDILKKIKELKEKHGQ